MLLTPTRAVLLRTEVQEKECSCHSHIRTIQILILVPVSVNSLSKSVHFVNYYTLLSLFLYGLQVDCKGLLSKLCILRATVKI